MRSWRFSPYLSSIDTQRRSGKLTGALGGKPTLSAGRAASEHRKRCGNMCIDRRWVAKRADPIGVSRNGNLPAAPRRVGPQGRTPGACAAGAAARSVAALIRSTKGQFGKTRWSAQDSNDSTRTEG
jgi:hypothetical protein